MSDLETIQEKIIAFRNERDWAQFHDPKNLAEALSIEAGELTCPVRGRSTRHSHTINIELGRVKNGRSLNL